MKRNQSLRQRPACDCCYGSTLCRRTSKLRRSAPPSRHGSLPRRTPLKPNTKRAREKFRENYHSSEFVRWIHGFPCAHCEACGWTEAAHVKRRSQGGKVENNIVPLCDDRVVEVGNKPIAVKGCHTKFDHYEMEEHRLRFQTLAKSLWSAWCRRNPNEGGGE